MFFPALLFAFEDTILFVFFVYSKQVYIFATRYHKAVYWQDIVSKWVDFFVYKREVKTTRIDKKL